MLDSIYRMTHKSLLARKCHVFVVSKENIVIDIVAK